MFLATDFRLEQLLLALQPAQKEKPKLEFRLATTPQDQKMSLAKAGETKPLARLPQALQPGLDLATANLR